jgi:hypothetical protein
MDKSGATGYLLSVTDFTIALLETNTESFICIGNRSDILAYAVVVGAPVFVASIDKRASISL